MLEDRLGQRRPDSRRAGQVFHSGAQHALKSAELPQERPASRGPESRHRLQHRSLARSCPFPAMSADREPVGFVARALDQVQSLRIRRKYRGRVPAQQENALLSCAPVRAFGDGGDGWNHEFEFLQDARGFRKLSLAAVNQQEIRERRRLLLAPAISPHERLAQGAIIVSTLDALDVVTAIFGLDRTGGAEDNAGGIRSLPLRVTDIETLDSLNGLADAQELAELRKLLRQA